MATGERALAASIAAGLALLGLACCAGQTRPTSLTPVEDQRQRLAAVPGLRIEVAAELPEGPKLSPAIAEAAGRLLAYAEREALPADSGRAEAALRITLKGWIDPPTWRTFPLRDQRSDRRRAEPYSQRHPEQYEPFLTAEVWGTIAWELRGDPVLRRNFSGRRTYFYRPYAYDPLYPAAPFYEGALDVDGSLMATLAEMIGQVYGPQPLVKTLKDEDWRLRRQACRGLAAFEAAQAARPLVEVLNDERSEVRDQAAETLKSLTGQDFGRDREAWSNWLKGQGL